MLLSTYEVLTYISIVKTHLCSEYVTKACTGCPAESISKDHFYCALDLEYKDIKPERIMDLITTYIEENELSYMNDFLSHFPYAKLDEGKEYPEVCREEVYGDTNSCSKFNLNCKACWKARKPKA